MPKESKKILIVEDEHSLSAALVDKFTMEGFTVLTAKDGKEGLDRALIDHPDLILLDILMPVMDGMTMLFHLRKDSWGKNVQVVLLTNLSDVSKVSESLAQGVSDFLVKSDWKLEDVVQKVKEKLAE